MQPRLLPLMFAASTFAGGAWAFGCAAPPLDEEPAGVADPDSGPVPAEGGTGPQKDRTTFDPTSEAGPSVPSPDGGADADAGRRPCAEPNVVGCFTFEGTTAEDKSPTMLVPSYLQGVTLGVGHTGKGLDVQPVTNIRFAYSNAFNVPNITVEAFIKVAALPAATQVIFDADARFAMALAPTGEIQCNATPNAVRGGTVPTGRWVHVACVIGGGQVRVFVDGLLTTQAGGKNGGGTGEEAIAGEAPDGNDRFVGSIDTLRIFKVARTASEIFAAAR